MNTPGPNPPPEWWGERIWQMHAQVSAHERELAGLRDADDQQRERHDALAQKLDREITELRKRIDDGFADQKKQFELHVGALRSEIMAQRPSTSAQPPSPPPAPPADDAPKIPTRWLIALGFLVLATVASASFGIGAASRESALERAIAAMK